MESNRFERPYTTWKENTRPNITNMGHFYSKGNMKYCTTLIAGKKLELASRSFRIATAGVPISGRKYLTRYNYIEMLC